MPRTRLALFGAVLPPLMVAVALTGASAQTAQPTPPAAHPAAPAAGGMPMQQHMEHGRQMQGTGQKMMEREKGEHTGMGTGAMGAPPCPPAGQPASGGAANCK